MKAYKEFKNVHLRLLGKSKKDGLMDYLQAVQYAQEVKILEDGDKYIFNFDMEKKPIGFIYTNFYRWDYQKMKE